MCMGGSSTPPPPPPTQAAQPADAVTAIRAKRQAGGMAGGTLLTGPDGVSAAQTASALSRPSLLGQ